MRHSAGQACKLYISLAAAEIRSPQQRFARRSRVRLSASALGLTSPQPYISLAAAEIHSPFSIRYRIGATANSKGRSMLRPFLDILEIPHQACRISKIVAVDMLEEPILSKVIGNWLRIFWQQANLESKLLATACKVTLAVHRIMILAPIQPFLVSVHRTRAAWIALQLFLP